MTEKTIRKKYYKKYVLAYLIMASLFYGAFGLNGKTFIWAADGWDQHIKAMVYYAKWLRTVFTTVVVNHSLSVPTYSFSIGYGADIITTLQYYGVGDPITSLCVLCPVSYMQHYYALSILLRLFFAGLFFSYYCFETFEIQNTNSVLAAGLVFTFSGYSMLGVRHPLFLVVLMWTPLILAGLERIWRGYCSAIYIIAVFLAAISNFFFFYTIVIFAILYTLIKFVTDERAVCVKIRYSLKCLCGGLLGTGIASFILLPTLYAAANDARQVSSGMRLLYSLQHYNDLPNSFLSFCGGNSYLGFGGVGLVSYGMLLLEKNKGKIWRWISLILVLGCLFQFVGKIADPTGTGRWLWYWSLPTAVAVLLLSEAISSNQDERLRYLFIIPTMFLLVSIILNWNVSTASLLQMMLGFFLLWVIQYVEKHRDYILLFAVMISIVINVHYTVGFGADDFTKDFIDNKPSVIDDLQWTDTAKLASERPVNEFYRITGEGQELNSGILNGVSSIQYYWSLSNPNVAEYIKQLCVESGGSIFKITSYDHRLALEAMASVKYNLDGSEKEYYLPFAYLQNNQMTEKDAEELKPLEKQQLMLDSAIVQNEVSGVDSIGFNSQCQCIPLEVDSVSDGIIMDGNTFTVLRDNAEITMKPERTSGGEVYYSINNLTYRYYSELEFYRNNGLISNVNKYEKRKLQYQEHNYNPAGEYSVTVSYEGSGTACISKKIEGLTENNSYYYGKNDYLLYLGDFDESIGRIRLVFPKKGVYSFDDSSLQTLSKEYQQERIQKLKQKSMLDVNLYNDNAAFATRKITGKTYFEKSGLLVCSIPYSRGWKAYVDGRPAEITRTNYMYLSFPISEGEHNVELRYETPLLFVGGVVSAVSIIIFGVLAICYRRKQ